MPSAWRSATRRSSSQLRVRPSSWRSRNGLAYFPRQASNSSCHSLVRYSRYVAWLAPAWQSDEMIVYRSVVGARASSWESGYHHSHDSVNTGDDRDDGRHVAADRPPAHAAAPRQPADLREHGGRGGGRSHPTGGRHPHRAGRRGGPSDRRRGAGWPAWTPARSAGSSTAWRNGYVRRDGATRGSVVLVTATKRGPRCSTRSRRCATTSCNALSGWTVAEQAELGRLLVRLADDLQGAGVPPRALTGEAAPLTHDCRASGEDRRARRRARERCVQQRHGVVDAVEVEHLAGDDVGAHRPRLDERQRPPPSTRA